VKGLTRKKKIKWWLCFVPIVGGIYLAAIVLGLLTGEMELTYSGDDEGDEEA